MSMQCIAEGDLRAWLDRELEPAELETVETHLNECAACRAHSEELSARATLVMSALGELPIAYRRLRPSIWRWPILAWGVPVAAMAVCLLLAIVMWPRKDVVKVATVIDPHPPQVDSTPVAPQPPSAVRATLHRARRRPVVPQEAPFVALDDEPIETGVVMRVGTESGGIQADVLVGPDGRAHAIRILME
jgi:hypothetical protein